MITKIVIGKEVFIYFSIVFISVIQGLDIEIPAYYKESVLYLQSNCVDLRDLV